MENHLSETNSTTGMVRPVWNERQYFLDKWAAMNITVLICQRRTKDITQLCLESLLRYYPDIPILIVDGDSQDDSSLYLQWLSIKNPNVKVWTRPSPPTGFTSHGTSMHEALSGHILTKYVLLLDNDTIVERGGWIESMLIRMKQEKRWPSDEERERGIDYPIAYPIYALGSLMLPSRSGEAITPPKDETDVLRYAHPSCSMIDRDKYLEIAKTFTHWPDGQIIQNIASDHGSPLVWNMMGAADMGYRVEYYPVDKYVSHLSGASWCEPKTIWRDDHDVKVRPFVTFIVVDWEQYIPTSDDGNFEFISIRGREIEPFKVVIHGSEPVKITNPLYYSRFNVMGEYVCNSLNTKNTPSINEIMKTAISLNAPEEFRIGLDFYYRRDIWQKRECLL